MQEFQIQSNIPVLILTIALIVITVLGFLEFKKLSNRIDSIYSNIESMKGGKDTNNETDKETNNNSDSLDLSGVYQMDNININEQVQKPQMVMRDEYEEEYEINNKDEEVKSEREYEESVPQDNWDTKQLFITKNINQSNFTIDKDNTEKEIEEIEDDSYSEASSDEKSYRSSEYSEESLHNLENDGESSGGIINISEMLNTNNEDETNENDTVEELLNGVEGEELEKGLGEVISDNKSLIIDESMSVNQLKQICKDKGLSVSGNKSMLISRIKENQ